MVKRITMAAIMHCMDNPDKEMKYRLSLTYRHKTRAGHYINVLNQVSPFQSDPEGYIYKIRISLKNISFINPPANSHLELPEAPNLNSRRFSTRVYQPFCDFFSEREKEIIQEMAKGYDNKTIQATQHQHTYRSHPQKKYHAKIRMP
ncbi:MAG: hypothetical protein U5K51_02285 [Flavobacteriaceae bacterium]|nr:hypothetical protein [Flavobacteriaceae bacterium]